MTPDNKGGLSYMLLRYHDMTKEELIEIRDEPWHKKILRSFGWAKDDLKDWIVDTKLKIYKSKRNKP